MVLLIPVASPSSLLSDGATSSLLFTNVRCWSILFLPDDLKNYFVKFPKNPFGINMGKISICIILCFPI